MLYYNWIDVCECIVVNKANASKECAATIGIF